MEKSRVGFSCIPGYVQTTKTYFYIQNSFASRISHLYYKMSPVQWKNR